MGAGTSFSTRRLLPIPCILLFLLLAGCRSFGLKPGVAVRGQATIEVGVTRDGIQVDHLRTFTIKQGGWVITGWDLLAARPYITYQPDAQIPPTTFWLDSLPPGAYPVVSHQEATYEQDEQGRGRCEGDSCRSAGHAR